MPEPANTPLRKIVHIDMDAFFASVEQRDNPELRGKPVAVGGSAQRGVVAAASYEARQFGVRSAMASVTAARRCPALIFVPPRFEVYRQVSQQIRQIFARHSDLVEPLSLDEAYIDVSHDKQGIGSATRVAELIRAAIRDETGLTASAGVSYNKFLAKIASDQNKPDGIFIIRPEAGAAFVATLPVRRFYGVGPRTAERMAGLGINSGADLRDQQLGFLQEHFGKSARYLYHASRGIDHRAVQPDRVRKSVGYERTYGCDLSGEGELNAALARIIDGLWERISGHGVHGRTLTLKIKYADFQLLTRSRSAQQSLASKQEVEVVARDLLARLLPVPQGVRLMGLALSGLMRPDVVPRADSAPDGQRAFDF
jgi:DNA polymerase-4